jgi:inosose dehydratase
MSSFRLGFAPITWNNEDLGAEIAEPVPYTRLLDEVVEAGYSGTELGDGFPRDPRVLRAALDERGLALPSAWCGLNLHSADAAAQDREHTRRLCDLLAQVGASFVNLAHQGTPETLASAGRVAGRQMPAEHWDQLAERVAAAAEIARAAGLQALFHVHAGTLVETESDMRALLQRVPADLLKLCWDVGHALYGGIDPVAMVREYPERIAYLHLKDLDRGVLDRLCQQQQGFLDGVRQRVFTELGRGVLDVPGLLAALREIGYDGWLMVEQDSTWLRPLESARTSRAYLRSLGV